MASVLRSSLKAALTSSGYVSLPGLTAGWSPPAGNTGLGCGEFPADLDGDVAEVIAVHLEQQARGIEDGFRAVGCHSRSRKGQGGHLEDVRVTEHLMERPCIGRHGLVGVPVARKSMPIRQSRWGQALL